MRRPLEAACLYLCSPQPVVLLALDLMEVPVSYCRQLQGQVASLLKIPPRQVLIHTTHTHTAPVLCEFTQAAARLPEILARCAGRAVEGAVPAKIAVAKAKAASRLNIYRRGQAGDGLGFQTFWYGYQFRPGDDRPDASAAANEMRLRWLGRPAVYQTQDKPLWFDSSVDDTVQAVRFEDAVGRTIGSLVRFCAHPHLAGGCKDRLWDPDYPAVVRQEMQRLLGGECLFLQGTGADLVPAEHAEYVLDPKRGNLGAANLGPTDRLAAADDGQMLSEMARIASEIASTAVRGLESSAASPLESVRFAARDCRLPLDPCRPQSAAEARTRQKQFLAQWQTLHARGADLYEIRPLANRLCQAQWISDETFSLMGCHLNETAGTDQIEAPLAALALNGHTIVFAHSELPMATDIVLNSLCPQRSFSTVSLTGGCYGYVPTARMIDEGGYEGLSTIFGPGAHRQLAGDLADLAEEVNP
ncbi:MAG: hypothetical protein HZA50_11100 [Planctomycetes bacterium]|nr:hypothetical protein [Planctomycetota bacterium]